MTRLTVLFLLCLSSAACTSSTSVDSGREDGRGALVTTATSTSIVDVDSDATSSTTRAPVPPLSLATWAEPDGKESAASGFLVEVGGCVGLTDQTGDPFWPLIFVGLPASEASTDANQLSFTLPGATFELGTEVNLTGGWDSIENLRSIASIDPVVPDVCPHTGQFFLTNRVVGGGQAWRAF